jgi:hypothetical protein
MRAMAHHAFVAAPLQLFYRLLAARALQALMITHSRVAYLMEDFPVYYLT